MSTANVQEYPSGTSFRNVLTNDKGRIIDVVWQLHLEDATLLLSGYRTAASTREWIQKYIFSEDIIVEDLTDTMQRFSVTGPDSMHFLKEKRLLHVSEDTGGNMQSIAFGDSCLCFRDIYFRLPVFTVLYQDVLNDLMNEFHTGNTDSPERKNTEMLFEKLRIESGIPVMGKEIDATINPLEAGLKDSVSFGKGCYIGQEVIARIETYGKLQKRLVGFSFPASHSMNLQPGNILSGQHTVGRTTSHCYSEDLGRHIALGFLMLSADPSNLALELPQGPTKAVLHSLPFEVC